MEEDRVARPEAFSIMELGALLVMGGKWEVEGWYEPVDDGDDRSDHYPCAGCAGQVGEDARREVFGVPSSAGGGV